MPFPDDWLERVEKFFVIHEYVVDFPGGSVVENPSVNGGDAGSLLGCRELEKEIATSPVGNPMDRGLAGYIQGLQVL